MLSGDQLHRVVLRGIPVEGWARTRDWFEGLLREFEVIASDTDSTPRRLLGFVAEARERFATFGSSDEPLDRARSAGELTVDVELELPSIAASAARELLELVEQSVAYCQSGDLLSLTPSPEVMDFTRWYLNGVAQQVEGAGPVTWPGGSSGQDMR